MTDLELEAEVVEALKLNDAESSPRTHAVILELDKRWKALRHFERVTPDLIAALRDLVLSNEEHNAAVAAVIGTPVGWHDGYLDAARAALKAAEERT